MTAKILFVFLLCCTISYAQLPSDADIRKILANRVGAENNGAGIVVGVIDANSRRVISYGSFAKDDNRKLGGDTVFEIGSMTKVFTSLVLMDMVRRGEIALTDPISKYLPETVKVPERNGRKVTFADLSTQSSGLPRLPSNLKPKDMDNPYADYSVQQLYDFLSGYQLTRDIGSKYEYSNLGVGLLGHVLSLRAGMSYEEMVRKRICDPLGMADTRVTLTPEMKARLAIGHKSALTTAANWDIPTLAGAGALRSTANDILTLLAANLGFTKTPLAQDLADEVSIRRPTDVPGLEIAYAWHVLTNDGKEIIWHDGGTGGYRAFMGFDPKAQEGVIVLTNISTAAGVGDIGRHLLDASSPLQNVAPPVERKEITLDNKIFDRYVGTYEIGPYTLMTISRDGNHFFGQITGQQKLEMIAEAERKFFTKAVDAQITFDVDEQSAATKMTLHQGGRDRPAKRLSDAEAEARKTAIDRREKENKPSPGTEAALRRIIQEIQRNKLDYDLIGENLAVLMRQQLPQINAMLTQLGALESITFQKVGPGGSDRYEAKFEHGVVNWTIGLTAGKIDALGLRPQ